MTKQSRNPNNQTSTYSGSSFKHFGIPSTFGIRASSFFPRQFHREIDRCDHAIGTRDALSGDLKCSAMIRTGAREWQPQSYVHAAVECVQLERDQSLVVVHAKHRVEFAFDRAIEDCVW